ncbi:MBL fold metallo-hydrolase [Parabacteroides pacaensis]|uniref:MBL fold metallo-hydrolase n=1 Tax=Parabacteroides pacaensis TaxID=2086575 RepID=UPI001F42D1FC|nr:MBL fold metallo-hydrolase [Parabacteroides pacaensis]
MCALLTGFQATAGIFESDVFTTKDGKELKLTFIKHASLLLTFDNKTIYIDPVSEYADYSKLPKADVILITHEHGDHLDPQAISLLEKPSTILIANASSVEKLPKGKVMKNGDKLQPLPWLTLEALLAYNTTPGREKYHPKGRDNGYVLTLGGSRIYIAGDTEDIPEMKDLKDIDIAFLPVNQPYTMTVKQAVRATKMFNPSILYPYHYSDTNITELKDALKDDKETEVRIRQLQ